MLALVVMELGEGADEGNKGLLIQLNNVNNKMIKHYDILRQKYIVDGYAEAYAYLELLESACEQEEILLSNFYCYITIQSQYKVPEAIIILRSCLQSEKCTSSLKALTLYHISQALFKIGELEECKEQSERIIQEFIGEYYSLEKRFDKTETEINQCDELQQLLYYAFLMVAYVLRDQSKMNDSEVFLSAGKRIMKDRKNLLTLTKNGRSTNTSYEEGEENSFLKAQQYNSF